MGLARAGRYVPVAGLLAVALAGGCGESSLPSADAPARSVTRAPRLPTKPKADHRLRGRTVAPAHPATHARTAERAAGTAAAALAALSVKGRAPKTGYSREQFGDGWIDRGGCDTRDRILTRDLTARTYLDRCRVASGTLADPYTSASVRYMRGGASEVDIDHVVALSDAWQKGAQQWTSATRVAFANDPLELLAVDAHANRSKGDGDAATWLPPNKAFRCAYVARQIAVKRKYTLWVTHAERDAIRRVLARCPGQRLPPPGAPIRVIRSHAPLRPTVVPGQTGTHRNPGSGRGHVYANCAEARKAGVTPILRGTPDYAANPRLDRDHDGIACEQ